MQKNQQALEKKSRHTSSTVETQNAPTPRPWSVSQKSKRKIIDKDGQTIASVGRVEKVPESVYYNWTANAELICRAVNSFDALVEALNDVRTRILASEHWWMDSPFKGGLDLNKIEAALAVAGKAPSVPKGSDNHLAAPVIP